MSDIWKNMFIYTEFRKEDGVYQKKYILCEVSKEREIGAFETLTQAEQHWVNIKKPKRKFF
jgi:hypothetical protein